MSTVRTRQRQKPAYAGTIQVGSYPPTVQPSGWSFWESTTDVVGNLNGDNPFSLERSQIVEAPVLNTDWGFYKYRGLLPLCARTPRAPADPALNLTYPRTVLEAIKDSHPGSPTFSLPNFIWELRELPGMIQRYIRLVRDVRRKRRIPPSEASNEWLAYNFGWAPLFSDLKSLYDVAEGVKRQARRIDKAIREGYVSTNGKRGSAETKSTALKQAFDSAFGGVYGTRLTEVRGTAWTTSKWRLDPILPVYGLLNGGHRNLLLDQLGLDVSFDTVWNAIPWSWLVDWTTDASSILSIYSNVGGFRHIRTCSMEHKEFEVSITPTSFQDKYGSNVVIRSETKSRVVVNPSIRDVTFNVFTPRQVSLLAAIMISRSEGVSIRTS